MTETAFVRRLALLMVAILVLVVVGTAGFTLTTERNPWDALVLTVDTIATVGSIPHPEQTGAQILKLALIVTGVGTLFYALVTVTEFLVAGHLGEILAGRQAQRMIDSLSDHIIICGFGRVGQQVSRDLTASATAHVVVDINPQAGEAARAKDVPFVAGQAGEDHVLRAAGIERARAVIACVDDDAENIFITLSARDLREDITIVARAAAEESERKLLRAGADNVVSPYKSSGQEMARSALEVPSHTPREVKA